MNKPLIEGLNIFKYFRNSSFILNAVSKLILVFALHGDIIIDNKEIISMIFVKQGRLSVELVIDMREIQNKINEYKTGISKIFENIKLSNKRSLAFAL